MRRKERERATQFLWLSQRTTEKQVQEKKERKRRTRTCGSSASSDIVERAFVLTDRERTKKRKKEGKHQQREEGRDEKMKQASVCVWKRKRR